MSRKKIKKKRDVLLVENDEVDRIAVMQALPKKQFHIDSALNADGEVDEDTVMELLDKKHYDVMLLDLAWTEEHAKRFTQLGGVTDISALENEDTYLVGGLSLLCRIRETEYRTPVMVFTGFYSDNAVKLAMRKGAGWIISKPIDPDDTVLAELVEIASRYGARDEKAAAVEQIVENKYEFENIVGETKVMQKLFRQIRILASNPDLHVLLQGGTGTGKELVAGAIHRRSSRRDAPFITVHCPGIQDTLFESDLFGHKKGAFTNAVKDKKGRLELAANGTVFLDEVADLSATAQAKLLRFLQEKMIEPVGSTTAKKVDVRVIAATKFDLKERVDKGSFRDDLYYRLGNPLYLPSLQERKKDILLLAQHFAGKCLKGQNMQISKGAQSFLREYKWLGNVRELEKTIEYAATFARERGSNEISFEDLPERIRGKETASVLARSKADGMSLSERMTEIERAILVETLERHDWIRKEAAEELGITTDQMKKLVAKHNLQGVKRAKGSQNTK